MFVRVAVVNGLAWKAADVLQTQFLGRVDVLVEKFVEQLRPQCDSGKSAAVP